MSTGCNLTDYTLFSFEYANVIQCIWLTLLHLFTSICLSRYKTLHQHIPLKTLQNLSLQLYCHPDQGRIQSLSLGGGPCRAPLPSPPHHPPFLPSLPPSLPCPFPILPLPPSLPPPSPPLSSLSLPLKRGVRDPPGIF